jgi:hypothetical protein
VIAPINEVIGGVGDPRFLNCGPELCTNPSFESAIVSPYWYGNAGANIVRTADVTTCYGSYSGKISGAIDPENYVLYPLTTIADPSSRHFIAMFWAKADVSTKLTVALQLQPEGANLASVGLRSNPTKILDLTDKWKFVFVEGVAPIGQSGQMVKLIIWPFNIDETPSEPSVTQSVYIDEVSIREVFDDISMSSVTMSMTHGFDKVVKAKHDMLDGSEKESRLGHRYTCTLEYEYISAAYEVIRRGISVFQNIVFLPHNDVDWAYLANMDSFTSGYSWNSYLGHTGGIKLSSVKVFKESFSFVLPPSVTPEGGGEGFGENIFIG